MRNPSGSKGKGKPSKGAGGVGQKRKTIQKGKNPKGAAGSSKKNKNANKQSSNKPATPFPENEIAERKEATELNETYQRISNLSTDDLKKLEIAYMANEIMNKPRQEYAKIDILLLLCNDDSLYIKKLTLTSLSLIFKHVLPGYRIKGLEDGEDASLSKEIKMLRSYESFLLNKYTIYLKTLEKCLRYKVPENFQAQTGLRMASLRCLCELFSSLRHFNYASNILGVICGCLANFVEQIRTVAEQEVFALMASKAKSDYEFKLQALKHLSKDLKKKSQKLFSPHILDCILDIDLTVGQSPAEDKASLKSQMKKSKKKKKGGVAEDDVDMEARRAEEKAEREALDKEFDSMNAEMEYNRLSQINQNILREAFNIYFSLLTHYKNSPLIPGALKGIAQLSHLINVELVMEVMNIVKDYLASHDNTLQMSLSCVYTIFQLLTGPAQVLNIEGKDVLVELYYLLGRFTVNESTCSRQDYVMLLRCLELGLLKRRIFSNDVVASFVRQMVNVATSCCDSFAIALLFMVKQLTTKYSKIRQMLELDLEFNSLSYEIDDPQLTNSINGSILWELIHMSQSKNNAQIRYLAKTIVSTVGLDSRYATLTGVGLFQGLFKIRLDMDEMKNTQFSSAKKRKAEESLSAAHKEWMKYKGDAERSDDSKGSLFVSLFS